MAVSVPVQTVVLWTMTGNVSSDANARLDSPHPTITRVRVPAGGDDAIVSITMPPYTMQRCDIQLV